MHRMVRNRKMYKDSADGTIYGSRFSYAARATWELIRTDVAQAALEWGLNRLGLLKGSLDGKLMGVVIPKSIAVIVSPLVFVGTYIDSKKWLEKIEVEDREKIGWGPH